MAIEVKSFFNCNRDLFSNANLNILIILTKQYLTIKNITLCHITFIELI